MTEDRWTRAKEILSDLLDAEPDNPGAWLDDRCGDDRDIRGEVESLLEAHEHGPLSDDAEAVAWLGRQDPAADRTPLRVERPKAGAQIGAYRLLEEIGVGGMSVVYRAERADAAFEQTVAVKLLQRRLHADDAGQRFRAERQVLASLDHPNVARLLDGGVTEGGRPYLVMEYVDGQPITEYTAANDLGLDARLDLLEQVTDAVQAAHRQLVVHRDLKPSNVLVTETDTGPTVKLLDFGIAKLLDDSLPVTRPETRTGHHLMTPSYAAPEQVTGADVTTATDVYQLGVLAYELLAGTRPFDLEGKSLTQIERLVVETDPPPPSARGTGTGVEPGRLQGDLDTIIGKALRKEPERRYRSVEALAADLHRHRREEPVEARPATLRYRTRKFVQRNRWGVGVAATFFLVVALAGTMLIWQRNRAQRNAQRAQREEETAEQVSSYLVDLFEASDPLASNENLSATDLLERGMDRIDRLSGQPLVRAKMLTTLGRANSELGNWSRAQILLNRGLTLRRKHLDPPHPALVSSLYHLAAHHRTTFEFATARPVYENALAMDHRLGGTEHRAGILKGLANATEQLGAPDSATVFMRRSIEVQRRRNGEDYPDRASDQMQLARIIQRKGNHQRAKQLYRTGLQRMQTDTASYSVGERAAAHSNFAHLLNEQGAYAEAEDHAREALSLYKQAGAITHFKVRRTRTHLYGALVQQGKYEQARSVRRTQLEVAKQQYDPPHYRLAVQYGLLGHLLSNIGHVKRALPLLRRSVTLMTEYAGPDNLWTHQANLQYALGLLEQGRFEEARPIVDRAAAAVTQTHPDSTSLSLDRLKAFVALSRGQLHAQNRNWARAESLLVRGYRIRRSNVGYRAPLCQNTLRHLVAVYERSGRSEQAAAYRDSLLLQ